MHARDFRSASAPNVGQHISTRSVSSDTVQKVRVNVMQAARLGEHCRLQRVRRFGGCHNLQGVSPLRLPDDICPNVLKAGCAAKTSGVHMQSPMMAIQGCQLCTMLGHCALQLLAMPGLNAERARPPAEVAAERQARELGLDPETVNVQRAPAPAEIHRKATDEAMAERMRQYEASFCCTAGRLQVVLEHC